MTQAGSSYPLLRKGERVTDDVAMEAHRRAVQTGEEVLIRTSGDWNNASTMKSRMESSKTFEPYAPDLVWYCQRIGPDSIGLYVAAHDG